MSPDLPPWEQGNPAPQGQPQGQPQGPAPEGPPQGAAPQGQPQGPAPYHQQGQPQQGYPQQGYQMGQPQYYPPQKKGFPTWAIVLIVVGVVMFIVVPVMALAALPLITSNTRDARRAEGEQMMQAAKNQARVYYAQNGNTPMTLTEVGLSHYDLDGQYYRVDDHVGGTGGQGIITCSPVQSPADGNGQLTFSWNGGEGTVQWN